MDRTEFKQFIANNSNKLIIVKAHAIWCAPCKRIAPLIDNEISALMTEYGANNVIFKAIDMDEDSDVANYLKIKKLPTLISYIDGEPAHVVQSANEIEINHFFKKSNYSYSLLNRSDKCKF